MQRKQKIHDILVKTFCPTELEVMDDSARHAGHREAGAAQESHFRIRITSAAFCGQSRLERHRLIHAALAGEFAGGLHALQISALAPDDAGRN